MHRPQAQGRAAVAQRHQPSGEQQRRRRIVLLYLHGFQRALAEANVAATPELQADAITTEEAGYAATEELLRRGAQFDAIVGASDLIAQNTRRAGEVLVETLLRQIHNDPAQGQVLPTRLVVRRSCGANAHCPIPPPAARRSTDP